MPNNLKDLFGFASSPFSSPERDLYHTREASLEHQTPHGIASKQHDQYHSPDPFLQGIQHTTSQNGDACIDLTSECSPVMGPENRERHLSGSIHNPHAHVSHNVQRPYEQLIHSHEEVENIIRQYQEALDHANREKRKVVQHLEAENANLRMKSESEKAQLKKEILAYKARIVKLTETPGYKTDDAISAAWEKLYSDVQGWACHAYRTLKPDFSRAGDTLWLDMYMPLWRLDNSSAYRLNILLASAAASIEHACHHSWEFGATRDSPLTDLAIRAIKLSKSLKTQEYKQWLALTQALLQETSNEQLQEAKSDTTREMLRITKKHLRALAGIDLTKELATELANIFMSALDVVNCIRLHPATFHVRMIRAHTPGQRSLRSWSCDLMQDMTGKNDDELQDAWCGGCIFPSIRKVRNEDDDPITPVSIVKVKMMGLTNEEFGQITSSSVRRS